LARRARKSPEVSLFPFLSVLACVIGALTLILASMAVSFVGSSALEGVRLGEQVGRAQAALLEATREREALETELATAQARDADREELHLRLAGLGLSPEIDFDELERLVDERRKSSEAAKLDARRDRLQAKLASLDERRSGLRADVEQREDARRDLSMRIAPAGLGPAYRPYFAECTADYVEIHTTRSDFTYRVPREDLLRGLDFQRFLRRIRVLRNTKLVFLVRPDGVESYRQAAEAARRLDVEFAKLPLPGDGKLDFSAFDVPDEGRGS
jgi:multidrug efflux pump subunit AcrA (membrane-fusion protein)